MVIQRHDLCMPGTEKTLEMFPWDQRDQNGGGHSLFSFPENQNTLHTWGTLRAAERIA